MAGKKEYSVVSVISGLTFNQASDIASDIMKSKQKRAPHGRGTAASGLMSEIGSLLQDGRKYLGGD